MIDQKLINRINELASISKQRKLTEKEEIERKQLREEYLKQFKAGFRQQLDGVKVVDEKGNDVTPNRKGEA
jgi:uncharacterized protein YnzC (UPF0291/DUF896 family)